MVLIRHHRGMRPTPPIRRNDSDGELRIADAVPPTLRRCSLNRALSTISVDGATTNLFEAAALGHIARVKDSLATDRPTRENGLDRRSWATRENLRIAIVTWTEQTYHRRRR